jgi:hypothetical protein
MPGGTGFSPPRAEARSEEAALWSASSSGGLGWDGCGSSGTSMPSMARSHRLEAVHHEHYPNDAAASRETCVVRTTFCGSRKSRNPEKRGRTVFSRFFKMAQIGWRQQASSLTAFAMLGEVQLQKRIGGDPE